MNDVKLHIHLYSMHTITYLFAIYYIYNAFSCLNVFCFCDESQILAQWQLLQQAKIKRCSIAPQNETPETVEVKKQLVALEAWHPISTMIWRLWMTKSINSYSYKLFEIRSHLALPSFAPSWGKVLVWSWSRKLVIATSSLLTSSATPVGSGSNGYLLQLLHKCRHTKRVSLVRKTWRVLLG